MQTAGRSLLDDAGYRRYEVSAYAQPGRQCRHNLNYWQFGDYLGIGAGAHSKISNAATQTITRTSKVKHPRAYLDATSNDARISSRNELSVDDVILEFAMNSLRLDSGFTAPAFTAATSLPCAVIETQVHTAIGASIADRRQWHHQGHSKRTALPERVTAALDAGFITPC